MLIMNKIKIPPLALTSIFLNFMFILSWSFPQFTVNIPSNVVASIILAAIALLICIAGVVSFRIAQTTVNPNKPEQASTLVIKGIYRVSRNPMYLGFLLLLIAWGMYLSHWLSLLLLPTIFVIYINRFQIPLEEEALHLKFGDEFISYKKLVHKWL